MDLAIYTNGGEGIGLGHVYRMLEFVRKSGVNPSFYSLDKSCFKAGHKLLKDVVLLKDKEELFKINSKVLLMDSFDLDLKEEELSRLRKTFKTVLVDDACYLKYYDVDVLINPNLYAQTLNYTTINSKLLFAPLFLRSEFDKEKIFIKPKLKNLVLTLGGSDDADFTSKLIEIISPLLQARDLMLHVVKGPAFKHKIYEKGRVLVHENPKMSELMQQMDAGVIGCGQSVYEFFALGIPCLGFIMAKNQQNLANFTSQRAMLKLSSQSTLEKDLLSLDLNARLLMQANIKRYFNCDFAYINELVAKLLEELC